MAIYPVVVKIRYFNLDLSGGPTDRSTLTLPGVAKNNCVNSLIYALIIENC